MGCEARGDSRDSYHDVSWSADGGWGQEEGNREEDDAEVERVYKESDLDGNTFFCPNWADYFLRCECKDVNSVVQSPPSIQTIATLNHELSLNVKEVFSDDL